VTQPAWETRATLRLAIRRQGSGDYRPAAALYEQVLRDDPGHRTALHNLAVCHIRQGHPADALARLDELEKSLVGDAGSLNSLRRWSPLAFALAYNRALARDYEDEPGPTEMSSTPPEGATLEAHQLSRRVVGGILAMDLGAWQRLTEKPRVRARRPTRDVTRPFLARLEPAALVLRASLGVSPANAPTVLASMREFDPAFVASGRWRLDVAACLNAPGERGSLEGRLVGYVRASAANDPRTRYNLACFGARLSAKLEPLLGTGSEAVRGLREQAIADVKYAADDDTLVAWASQDPSLAALHAENEFWAVVERDVDADTSGGEDPMPGDEPSQQPVSGTIVATVEDAQLVTDWRETLTQVSIRLGFADELVSTTLRVEETGPGATRDDMSEALHRLPARVDFAHLLDRYRPTADPVLSTASPGAVLCHAPSGPFVFRYGDAGPEIITNLVALPTNRQHLREFIVFVMERIVRARHETIAQHRLTTPASPAFLVVVSRSLPTGESVVDRIPITDEPLRAEHQVAEAVTRLHV
jgi:Tetratricopeptide repeat